MPGKLCFVIPEYRAETATHFNYLYELIGNIQQEMDVFLIVERGNRPDFFKKGKVYVQKFRFLPLKLLENLLVLKCARLIGYKDFYIHYSFLSAFNASLIVKILGGRTFYWNCGLPWLYRRGFFRENFERLVYRLVTFLVTGTEGLKKEYSAHYSLLLSKIKVLPNWIDLEKVQSAKCKAQSKDLRKKLDIPTGAKILLFVHRLSKRKGAHYLPEILNQLRNEEIVLVIVGDGPERKSIELNVKSQMSNVRLVGWVPQNKILQYFFMADIFLLPSEEEGFPHVLLEAMAAGVPLAAFDVGGVGEIAPPEFSGYLADSGNINVFVQKVKELLHDDLKNSAVLKQSELNWVRQFDIKLAMKKFKNLF